MTSQPGQSSADGQPPTVAGSSAPPRRIALLAVAASAAYALDLLSKHLVVTHREGRPPLSLLHGALYISVTRNAGAAFSMASGMTWLFALIAVSVVAVVVWIAPRLRSVWWAVALGLVLAGALGNLTDRLARSPGPLRGRVVDFLSLFSPDGAGFAIFNVADSAICVGATLMVLMTAFGKDYDGSRPQGAVAAGG